MSTKKQKVDLESVDIFAEGVPRILTENITEKSRLFSVGLEDAELKTLTDYCDKYRMSVNTFVEIAVRHQILIIQYQTINPPEIEAPRAPRKLRCL